ncbi:MAG: ATP-grasp domain-containing protein [Gammaproteobacteria bacterium]|nr:ATP-grasp domain-containing protein [Gammaproteobacteria bacterium]
MRVFVFEYLTGGGCTDDVMLSRLAAEGDLMLIAVIRDLVKIDGVEVVIARDRRLEAPELPIEVHWVDGDWRAAWSWCLAFSDAVIPIAPETDGVLQALCHAVEVSGKRLLNSSAAAVALAADKQATLDRLQESGIPVVSSWRAGEHDPAGDGTLVLKPDMGVGCHDIHLIHGAQALAEFLATQPDPRRWLVQPYVEGKSASLSLLVGDGCVCLLGCNVQRVAQVDDGFVLLGCAVNGLAESREEFRSLALAICEAIPGLWGYVGVDFVLTVDGPIVLEVNPRLTTSYVGLSRSTGRNVAELLIHMAEDPSLLPPQKLLGECVHVDLGLGRVA